MTSALRIGGVVEERMRNEKSAVLGIKMGKSDDWARKILDGDSGIRLADLPALLDALELKCVSKEKVCVHPELARAYHAIVKRATAERDLLLEDAE
jgi:hypothetical protein